MQTYKYLLVGGGMAADAAAKGIREIDQQGSIGIIGMENNPPYYRPPLSKKLWQGKSLDSIWLKTEKTRAELLTGRKVVSIQPAQRQVTDDQGNAYAYQRLLIATGATPRHLPFGGENIIYYRDLNDFHHLHELSQSKERFAVIGGGFIGWEMAAALAMNGRQVSMLFPEESIGALIYPRDLSQFITNYYRDKGVEVLAGETASEVESQSSQYILTTQSGRKLNVDGIVAGIGVTPNTQLAREASLKVEKGILVNENLQTSDAHIFAAGDVAEFYNPALDRRLRIEHEDNAVKMGRQAGRNMAGANEPYHYLPYFYSDLFELGYEAVGTLDPRLEVVTDWKEPYQEGLVYYMDHGRVRGVLLWNVWGQVPAAQKLIAEPGPFKLEDLKERLPA